MPRLRAIGLAVFLLDVVMTFAACGSFEDAPATPPLNTDGDAGAVAPDAGPADGGGGGRDGEPPVEGGDGGVDLRAFRYRQAVLEDQPIAYWRMGEVVNGNSVPDEIGTNDLVLNGSPDFVTGVEGIFPKDDAIWFGGVSGSAFPADSTPFQFTGSAPFSIECWARRELEDGGGLGNNYQHLVSHVEGSSTAPDGSTENGYLLYIRPNIAPATAAGHGSLEGGAMESQGALVAAGKWAHYVMVMDGMTMKLFIDGDLAQSLAVKGPIKPRSVPLALARSSSDTRFFRGYLDEVAIYDKALTLLRVKAHYSIALQ